MSGGKGRWEGILKRRKRNRVVRGRGRFYSEKIN